MRKFALLAVLLLAAPAFAAPTIHQVALSWTQSTDINVTGNCIYRSQTSGGSYVQLFCSAMPTTAYIDLTVVGGQTYFYVVTAVALLQESKYSNPEVKTVIPQSPLPVTGVQALSQ